MSYMRVLKNFYVEWEEIQTLTGEDNPNVPVLSRNSLPLKWLESFRDCIMRTYGVRGCPLLYVCRDNSEFPNETDDPLLINHDGVILPYGL